MKTTSDGVCGVELVLGKGLDVLVLTSVLEMQPHGVTVANSSIGRLEGINRKHRHRCKMQ